MDKLTETAIDLKDTGFSPSDLLDPKLGGEALRLAKDNPRKRFIVRVHSSLADEQHLMINAILGESYVRPHMHTEPEKNETFRIVKGKAFVVFFDDEGKVTEKIELNDTPDGRKIVTVRPGRWHTFVPMSEETVILEAKRQPAGGYNADTDKVMAPWAPGEKDAKAGREYLRELIAGLDKAR